MLLIFIFVSCAVLLDERLNSKVASLKQTSTSQQTLSGFWCLSTKEDLFVGSFTENCIENDLYVSRKSNFVEILQGGATTTGVKRDNLWATSCITSCQFVKVLKLKSEIASLKHTPTLRQKLLEHYGRRQKMCKRSMIRGSLLNPFINSPVKNNLFIEQKRFLKTRLLNAWTNLKQKLPFSNPYRAPPRFRQTPTHPSLSSTPTHPSLSSTPTHPSLSSTPTRAWENTAP